MSAAAAAVAGLGLACYLNTLGAKFAFDDHLAITGNADVDPTKTGWRSMLTNDFWGQDITSTSSHKSYRPITIASFRLDALMAGELSPRLAHAVNALLHAGCVLALLAVLQAGSTVLGTRAVPVGARRRVALVAAILFAVHPVHTEAVAGVVGRAELLCFLLTMLATGLYDLSMSQPNYPRSLCRAAAAVAAVLLAIVSKETGIAVFGIFWCAELIQWINGRSGTWARLARALIGVWAALGYLGFRKWLTVHFVVGHEVFRRFENPIAFLPKTARIYSKLYVNSLYAGLALVPAVMSADYSFDCIKMLEYGSTDMRLLAPLAMIAGILALVQFCLKRLHTCAYAAGLLGSAVWLVVSFAPSTGVLVDPGTTVAERLLYMPSAGFCLAAGLIWAQCRRTRRTQGALLLGCLVTLGAIRTLLRNNDWRDEERLFVAAQAVCPDSVKVLLNTGILHRRTQEWNKSINAFRRALKVAPDFCESDYWIGLTMLNMGKPPEMAIRELRKGVDCKFTMKGSVEALHTIYGTLHASHPNNTQVLIEWAELLEKVEMQDEASKRLELAGQALLALPEARSQAADLFKRAEQLSPKRCEARFWAQQASSRPSTDPKQNLKLVKQFLEIAECGGNTKIMALEASADPLTKLLQADPDEPVYRLLQARVVELSGNLEASANQFSELGAKAYNEKRFRDAVSVLLKAVQLDATNCQSWIWLGHAQYQVGLKSEAVLSWKKTVSTSGSKAECAQAKQLAVSMLEQLSRPHEG